MTNNAEIIKAAKEIVDHLDRLLSVEDANKVREELIDLLEREDNDHDGVAKRIIELLSRHEQTKQWMNNRLSGSPKRGESHTATENDDAPWLYPVWFGTNREPIDKSDLTKGFKGGQCVESDRVYYGRCDVEVPETHRFGETGRAWWKRWVSLDFNGADALRINKIYTAQNAENFWNALNSSFLKNEVSERDALVFIHGFNTSFEDAAIRAAQIGFDLRVKGHTAFFSWPSKGGGIKTYISDGRSIGVSGEAIAKFLTEFAQKSGATQVHLIAHSMGNQGLLKALNKIMNEVNTSCSGQAQPDTLI